MRMDIRFTEEEFRTMVKELLCESPSHETLVRIADKTLKPAVIHWCNTDSRLKTGGHWEDLLQDIMVRLIITTVPSFLLRKDVVGPYNDDPVGFQKWMFTLAGNMKEDYAKRISRWVVGTEPIEEGEGPHTPSFSDADDDGIERLQMALNIVLSDDINIYKTLTWLAQFIFMLSADVTKIRSNELIISAFKDKTLNEMYRMLLKASAQITWMKIDEAQQERLSSKLSLEHPSGVPYGEMKYEDFFMKVKGEASGKKSISDWVNRINNGIRVKEKKDKIE